MKTSKVLIFLDHDLSVVSENTEDIEVVKKRIIKRWMKLRKENLKKMHKKWYEFWK